jgi:hypothetical protein
MDRPTAPRPGHHAGPTDDRTEGTDGAADAVPERLSPLAAGADLVAVLLFVVLGRRAHDEGSAVVGTLEVAWPFLTGTALGWAVLVLTGRPAPTSVRGGLVVLVATVVVGMALRRVTGGGVQVSFVVVATTVLALLLTGWRLLAARRAAH